MSDTLQGSFDGDLCQVKPRRFNPTVTRVEILKNGNIETFASEVKKIIEPVPRTYDVAATIFVVEADRSLLRELEPWVLQAPWPRRKFLRAHFKDDDSAREELESEAYGVFFADWWQIAVQKKPGPGQQAISPTPSSTPISTPLIQQLISSGKTHNADTLDDPLSLRLDHERYSYWPESPHRPFHLVSTSVHGEGQKTTYHAAQQRMSYYSRIEDGVLTGQYNASQINFTL